MLFFLLPGVLAKDSDGPLHSPLESVIRKYQPSSILCFNARGYACCAKNLKYFTIGFVERHITQTVTVE